ncbi:MAG: thioredoxin domain-containing protein, partial [Planctomycetes bacterium]|nr:thioredoxin domain-containing protein [Planctomycetota bacterium]
QGGFFQTASDGEALILRNREVYDGAIPSGNSVMLWNLARLGRLVGKPEYEDRVESMSKLFSLAVQRTPQAHTQFLIGLDFYLGPTRELVISGAEQGEPTQAMLRALAPEFLPRLVTLVRPPGDAAILSLAPYAKALVAPAGKTLAYLCENHACKEPVATVQALLDALGIPQDR